MGQGERALVEGRFRECERLAAGAATLAPAEAAPRLLAAIACREQGRAAEAEVLVRPLLAAHPDAPEAAALLGAVLADLGRDAEARRQLDLLDPASRSTGVAVLAAETAAALDSPEHAEAWRAPLAAQAGVFTACHGSVSRPLGLVCHVLGCWDEAEAHFGAALDANLAAGAPVLVAHTRRHLSALLRARGDDGDWERAIDLLAQASTTYRRLDIGRLAAEAEAVLRRSQDPSPADSANVFRRVAGGWELTFAGRRAEVADVAGLGHIAALLAAAGRPVHVLDLVEPSGEEALQEYRARLAEVDRELAVADPVAAALGRAERDFLCAELTVLSAPAAASVDSADRARRLVALRIRTALDRMEGALPALARHLHRSLRTGTFCLYEPERPDRWRTSG